VIEAAVDALSWIALVVGGLFYVVGAVGLNRMPDVFTRMHAVSVGDTLGAGLLVTGMLLQAGPTLVAAKLVLIILVLLFTGSVATHALARAALQDGVRPVVAGRDGRLVQRDAAEAVLPLSAIAPAEQISPEAEKETGRSNP
jgi:multicomponent Na+:H+ antiporter subunit G